MKKLVFKILTSRLFLTIISPFLKFSKFIEMIKYNKLVRKQNSDSVIQLPELQKLKVLNGPFSGMLYPDMSSLGSTFIPKLIGSYEAELHPIIEVLIGNSYREIWDVGCAEGYYAVGFAIRSKDSFVRAFDIDPNSRINCLKMAKLNSVENRIQISEKCTAETINMSDFTKGLIISDCEGYEYDLIKSLNLKEKNLDFLIEVHEWPIDSNMDEKIRSLFQETHHIQIVKSKSDLQKAKHYNYFPLNLNLNLSLDFKYNCYKECRGENEMQWFYCTKI